MTQRRDLQRARDILARWCVIAEQRLDHLTELYESGRWRRYHSEAVFLQNLREAAAAADTWRALAQREAALDNTRVDVSWLGRRDGMLLSVRVGLAGDAAPLTSNSEALRAMLPPVAPVPRGEMPAATQMETVEEVTLEEVPRDRLPIAQRYPVLHNAL